MLALVNPSLLPAELKQLNQTRRSLYDESVDGPAAIPNGTIIKCSEAKSMIQEYYKRLDKASKNDPDINY
jgi:hypothetical protein